MVYDKVDDVESMDVDDVVMIKMFEHDDDTIVTEMVKDIIDDIVQS